VIGLGARDLDRTAPADRASAGVRTKLEQESKCPSVPNPNGSNRGRLPALIITVKVNTSLEQSCQSEQITDLGGFN
jgi:hypothetical protein